MAENSNAELLKALQGVHDSLEPLSPEDRARVLRSVFALLDIPTPSPVIREAGSQSEPRTRVDQGSGPSPPERPVSLIELIQDKEPSTNAEHIALFAYYREKVEGVSRFARADLKEYFPRAKLPPPGNFDRDFGKSLGAGWIHEDGSDSYLTTKGLEAVEFGFPAEARTAARKKTTARRKTTTGKGTVRKKTTARKRTRKH